jgi:F-type H+-transporting ATPase subunit b
MHRLRSLVPVLLVLLPAFARAADEAYAAHAEAHHGPDWKTLAIAAVNFAVLLVVLRRFAWPLLQNFFFQRSEAIRKQLEQAQSRLRVAEAELGDLRRRLSHMDEETRRIVADFTEQAARERERSVQRAEQAAARIREEAHRVADRELERARIALQAEAAELAANLAAELMRGQIRPDDQARLADDFIAGVERGVAQ